MDAYVLEKVEEKIRGRNLRARQNLNERKKALFSSHPELKALEDSKRLIICDPRINKDEKTAKINEIDKKINAYLSERNIVMPEIKYFCPICSDTGYVTKNGTVERCSCFTKLIIKESNTDDSAIENQNFDNFDENIFAPEIRQDIIKIRDYCKKYTESFPNVKRPNTVLCGNTGTGKTFLLSCIYHELKKKGHSVIFITAGKLFDILRKYAFNKINDIDVLISADMLIIDDMGTEPVFNNITLEYTFMLINERVRNNKPICISTNLTPDEIKARYTERIASRILDKNTTYILPLKGEDLRLK